MSKIDDRSSEPFAKPWRYLAMAEEAITLLKQGVIAVPEISRWPLPWFTSLSESNAGGVSEQAYQSYLQQAYDKLPAAVASLLTFEQFCHQANSKRAEIEAQLQQYSDQQQRQQQGSYQNWMLQRLYSQPDNMAAWQQHEHGLASIWLAVEPNNWPQVELHPVQYQAQSSLAYPQRLLVDPPDNQCLGEYRLLLQRQQQEKCIQVQGIDNALIRLPPNAIRALLIGSAVSSSGQQELLDFWYGDFRYQRIPVFKMRWQGGLTRPIFSLCSR